MLHYEELRQLSHDRGSQLRREADAQRLALQSRGQRYRHKRRLALADALGLLRSRSAMQA